MEKIATISFRKTGKKGGRIIGNFLTDDMPDFIWIKGTDDLARVRKAKKTWISRYKYSTLGMTILSLDDKFGIDENSYTNDGKVISNSPNATTLSVYNFDINARTVTFHWTTSEETNLVKFHILKQSGPDANADYSEVGTITPLGSGNSYSQVITFDNAGSLGIQLLSEYADGNELITLLDFVDIV